MSSRSAEVEGFIVSFVPTTAERPHIDTGSAPDLDALGIKASFGGVACLRTGRHNLAFIDGYVLGESSERLVTAVEEQDEGFLSRVHGNYCGLIIRPDGSMVGFCDRYGAKTLHWQVSEQHGVIISSRWLTMPVFAVQWDELGLSEMLRYRWTPGERTLVANISQLPHQYRVSFRSDGEVSVLKKGPQRRRPMQRRGFSFDEKLEETRAALIYAMGEGARHYDQAAVFLSGGVDSSLLAALATASFKKCLLVTPVFPGNNNPELAAAKAFADTLNAEHLLVEIETAKIEDDLRELVAAKGGQVNFHSLAMHQLMAAIPDSYKLVISGDAADTLFGLQEFAQIQKRLVWKRYADLMCPFGASFLARLPSERIRKICRLKEASYLETFLQHELIQYKPASMGVIRGLAIANTGRLFMGEAAKRYWFRPSVDLLRALQTVALKCNSANHFREIDLSATRFGKNVFAPFLAEPVYQAAMTLTRKQYFGDDYVKPILRELACEHYDRDLIYRRKQGFEVPFKWWLTKPLAHLVEAARREKHLFNGELLRNLDVEVHYSLFWILICWQLVNDELVERQKRLA